MRNSKEVQEEYLHLKHKVEGNIKELQGKLGMGSSHQHSNVLSQHHNHSHNNNNSQHHCHHHHCNHQSPPTAHFIYPPSVEMVSSEYHASTNKQSNSKSNSANELISEALVESLKNQRQINDHIKAINQKIQTISVQHNRSCLSEAFSDSVSKQRMRMPPSPRRNNFVMIETEKERCHSEVKTESRPSKKLSKLRVPLNIKKVRSKIKEVENIHSIHTERNRKKKTKSKSTSKFRSEYYLSFGCPIHSPQKLNFVSPHKKQIYKDSAHRNRKHEKNHLLQAFNIQQKSRKELVDKISHRAFNQYGKN